MRLRTYIALISGVAVILILVVIATQTRQILDRGFHELGKSDVTRAKGIVQAVIKSKRDNLTNFKKLIAADEEISKALSRHQLLPKLEELKALGNFDFVDFIFPNGTSAFGNEKRFGNGTHIDQKIDSERFSVVEMDGNLMLVSFCTKKKEEIGILVLGYRLTGPFEKRISELTGSNVKFITQESGSEEASQTTITAKGTNVFELARFPSRTLYAQITLDWTMFNQIDTSLLKSLLFSGGICLLVLLGFLYLLLEVGFVRRFESLLSGIRRATENMEAGATPTVEFRPHAIGELQLLSRAFSQFSQSINQYEEKHKQQVEASAKVEKQMAIASLAQQVAHDIRSPLAALEMFLGTYDELSEEPRNLMRGCVSRALDVANTLLSKSKSETARLEGDEADILSVPREVYLLSSLIEPIVSEKRVQYRNREEITIRTAFTAESYGLFVLLSSLRFKRILSNIIDNAVEAIDKKGLVLIKLTPVGTDKVSVTVEDNGLGIPPEVLPKLGTRGTTYGKTEGTGLGLHYAKTVIEAVGGEFTISSTPGVGTKVEGILKRAETPDWFVRELALSPDTRVIVIDDDPSIHHLWDERMKKTGLLLQHFHKTTELEVWRKGNGFDLNKCLFLCDYEFTGEATNGLDLIEKLGIQKQAFLVTTHFENDQIRARCLALGVGIIPKYLARFIPVIVNRRDIKIRT